MGCGVCSSNVGGEAPAGCKGNGGCLTGGCNKLNSFDWLGNMDLPGIDPFSIVEVRFKGGRKGFYRNVNRLFLSTGDPVVVESQTGHHVGFVAIQGELVRLQMKKKKVKEEDELPIIYRIATDRDLERLTETKKRELPTMYRTRQIVKELNLEMKLSDVEYQADNTKATFYYSADERVDFRELIKVLASEFKIRVEMRQISLRQEASRIGGIGSCGRELCCSTWLTEFQSVSTGAARYQNLSLNPNKLSGQCGRLKCCLNYELETYQDALLDIPKVDKPLLIDRGEATLQKVDIFKKQLWFSFENDSNWYPVTASRVIEIMELNAKGKKVETLEAPVVVEVEKSKKSKTRGLSKRGGNTAKKGKTEAKQQAENKKYSRKPAAKKKDPKQSANKSANQKTNAKPKNKARASGQNQGKQQASQQKKAAGSGQQKPAQQQKKAPNNKQKQQKTENKQKANPNANGRNSTRSKGKGRNSNNKANAQNNKANASNNKPNNKEANNGNKKTGQQQKGNAKKKPVNKNKTKNTNHPNPQNPPANTNKKRPSRRRRGNRKTPPANTPPKKED